MTWYRRWVPGRQRAHSLPALVLGFGDGACFEGSVSGALGLQPADHTTGRISHR